MKSPKKGRAPKLTLADLKPHQTIDCMTCEKEKPSEGSKKFHAQDVCLDCIKKLDLTIASRNHAKTNQNDAQRVF